MPDTLSSPVPSLSEAADSLAQLATQDALTHLEAALSSMQLLSATLRSGKRLELSDQRILERELLRFRAELRDAGVLAEQGLAHCRDWADLLVPPMAYQSNGISAHTSQNDCHELSVDA